MECDARQAGAVCEGISPDAGDTIRYRDARQAAAVIEGRNPDAGDAIRNRDARQAAAVTEGISPDAGDRIPSNGVWNNKFASSGSITIGDGDFPVSGSVSQVIQTGSIER